IRDHLDPFAEVSDLRGDIVAGQAVEFGEVIVQYKTLLEEIQAIKKALGR
ncbi:MAG: hypothetical protein GY846_09210, partial [Deltaproteobacteria bacterium]|nr:hypothetical protein [Deltaproteobacteria bacterium]